jgi:pyruvate/2-oxoglutarate dehydrogenase complex dihydrolipoamide acyltransferase (E2) component
VQQPEKKTANNLKEEILATPAVRNILKVNKLDIREIKGTGKNGRILKEDVNRFLEKRGKEEEKKTTSTQY